MTADVENLFLNLFDLFYLFILIDVVLFGDLWESTWYLCMSLLDALFDSYLPSSVALFEARGEREPPQVLKYL